MLIAAALILPHTTAAVDADAGGDRTLWLYHTHTHEEGKFTFRKNGQYDPKVLAQLNYFLRDWRNNKQTKIDPRLFDLLWTVYQKVGAKQPYNIVSAYRSPETNAYLRARSSGVAEHSQHILGHAMDVFIPGVSLVKLRQTAMQQQVGGVGFYPNSGSPFVHMDVGSVRAWPRMTTAQLRAIFPDGKTLHLPADGKPLSQSGRQFALAQWDSCHTVPCSNGVLTGGPIAGPATIQVASVTPADMTPAPLQRQVKTVAINTAPVPEARPTVRPDEIQVAAVAPTPAPETRIDPTETASISTTALQGAPIPATMSPRMALASRPALPGAATGQTAVMAIAALEAPVPAQHVMLSDKPISMVTAYASGTAEPGAEQALQAIIARADKEMPAQTATIATAALFDIAQPDVYRGLVDQTWSAVNKTGSHQQVAAALERVVSFRPIPGLKTRQGELVAPDLDHVGEVFIDPVSMSSAQYATLFEPDEADFDPSAELGPLVNKVYFIQDTGRGLSSSRFTNVDPLHLASR